ncbi:hypothetical protein ACWGCW_09080 [Streptomyces sp. NPDC054933]
MQIKRVRPLSGGRSPARPHRPDRSGDRRDASIDLGNVVYLVLGFFVLVWAYALGYWRLAKVERPWAATPSGAERAGP